MKSDSVIPTTKLDLLERKLQPQIQVLQFGGGMWGRNLDVNPDTNLIGSSDFYKKR